VDGWGWFFNIGIRVVDVMLLGAWLMWFFKQKFDDDGEPEEDDGFGDGGGNALPPDEPQGPPGGEHLGRPRRRVRDHTGRRGAGSRRPRRTRRRETVGR
jgi:hypothetical protein